MKIIAVILIYVLLYLLAAAATKYSFENKYKNKK